MKFYIIISLFLALLFGLTMNSAYSQESIRLNFEGIMRDIEEMRISEDEFKLEVKVLSDPSGEILLENSYSIRTDNRGWFGFELGEFDRFFNQDLEGTSTIVVNLGLFPTENSKWIEQGKDFPITYKILRAIENDSLLFEIARIQGSRPEELLFSNIEEMLIFQDSYPFGYLQGGFMISVDLSSEKLAILRNIIDEDSDASGEATKSRGVKGGFAVGGYRKTK
jgi:hypothetical protein